jgi:hypothetical protein
VRVERMRKMYAFATSIVVHALILCAVLQVFPVCNGRSSFSLGSMYEFDEEEEQPLDAAVSLFIATLATFRGWENVSDWYGEETTTINTCIAAGGDGDNYAITFYFGHGFCSWYVNGYHYYMWDNDGDPVYDFLIYQSTSARATKFAFLWSCYQAYERGGFYNGETTGYGPYGMPLAWLHTANLSEYGYNGPDGGGYAFIGWKNDGPQLHNATEGVQQAGYKFLLYFYCSALYYQNTLAEALDDAADAVWGYDYFGESPYNPYDAPVWPDMMVYGDGNLTLP